MWSITAASLAGSRGAPQVKKRAPPSGPGLGSKRQGQARGGKRMGAEENKQNAEAAYRAFSAGDAAGAMENMDDSCVWEASGDSAISGTYTGKQEIGELWGQLAGKEFRTEPHDFVADG